MTVDKKRSFIINFVFILIIAGIVYFTLKYAIKWVMPFLLAFLVAALLHPLVRFFTKKLKFKTQKPVAIVITTLFFCTFGVVITFILISTVTAVLGFIKNLPVYYLNNIAPAFNSLSEKFGLDQELIKNSIYSKLSNISSLLTPAFSLISGTTAFLMSLLIMVISTFFIGIDYDLIKKWTKAQMSSKTASTVSKIKDYVVKILFKYIRSYFLILCITFVELLIGFFVMHFITGLSNILLLAVLIAIFDILPIVGTGTIMIPWGIIAILTGDVPTGICCLVIYIIITMIRQFIEPKIVGTQVGLHPLVTLISMIVGLKLFGGIGLFGFPITLALLKDLNDHGHIHIFKPIPEEHPGEPEEEKEQTEEEKGESEEEPAPPEEEQISVQTEE